MAPAMMPLASLSYCLALLFLWPTTIATQGPADTVVGGGGSVNAAAVVEGACPLEKWSLDERQNRSQVVFTGVIESCQTSDSIDGDDQEGRQRTGPRLGRSTGAGRRSQGSAHLSQSRPAP